MGKRKEDPTLAAIEALRNQYLAKGRILKLRKHLELALHHVREIEALLGNE